MPEGDTVARQCRILDHALAGAVLTACDLRVPRAATADLVDWTVREVRPRGKHLLIRLVPPVPGAPPMTLHSHLMMDGIWHVDGRALRSSDTSAGPRDPSTIRIALEARHEDGREMRAIAYDVKQVKLLRTADEEQLLGSLGPDLLDPAWDEDPSLPSRSDRSASRCWTSTSWPGSGTSTAASCASCAGSTPPLPSPRRRTPARSSTSPIACSS